MTLQAPILQLHWKEDSGTGVFLWILLNFEEQIFYRTPSVAASVHSPPQTFSKKKTMTFSFHGCQWLLLKIRNSELLPDLMLLLDMMIMHLFLIVDNLYSKNAEKLDWQCHEKLVMTKNWNLFFLMKSNL